MRGGGEASGGGVAVGGVGGGGSLCVAGSLARRCCFSSFFSRCCPWPRGDRGSSGQPCLNQRRVELLRRRRGVPHQLQCRPRGRGRRALAQGPPELAAPRLDVCSSRGEAGPEAAQGRSGRGRRGVDVGQVGRERDEVVVVAVEDVDELVGCEFFFPRVSSERLLSRARSSLR